MSNHLLRQTALKFLARREYSQLELSHKLLQRSFNQNEVIAELDLLKEQGLQSDERFCEAFINERIRLGYGPRTIMSLLVERGITDALIERAMSVYSEAFWREHLQTVWQKRFGKPGPRDKLSLAEKARQYRFLNYRGFDAQAIYALLKQVDYEQQ